MKQYFLKVSGAILLLSLVAAGASAQEDTVYGHRKKTGKSDLIIITTTDGKDAKVTIEVKNVCRSLKTKT
jgi:hypothetical protein